MAIIDILIAVAIVLSMVVGFARGFMKEAISVVSLVVAIWAAMYFGPGVGNVADSWTSSEGLQMWFGRILVFVVVIAVGGLLGWLISKNIRKSALRGTDRFLGTLFGLARGVLLVAVFILGARFAGFESDAWWQESRLIPPLTVVADWIRVMSPKGLEMVMPHDENAQVSQWPGMTTAFHQNVRVT